MFILCNVFFKVKMTFKLKMVVQYKEAMHVHIHTTIQQITLNHGYTI